MHTFTKARMLWCNIYSISNERPLHLGICLFTHKDTATYSFRTVNERCRTVSSKVCLLAATTHSNLIFNLRRSTLTADAWRTSSGDCIDWQVGDYPTLLIWLVSLSALLNKLVFWEFNLDMFGITKLKIPYQCFQCFFQPATLSSYTCVTSGYNFLERKILHHISSFFYVSPLSKCGLPAQHQTADKNC